MILLTGGAGFIGSSFVRRALDSNYSLVVLDALTYAGHRENIEPCLQPGRCEFEKVDLRDFEGVQNVFHKYPITGVLNFAAESHVDNSIAGPRPFVETNVMGTFHLLEAAREHWAHLTGDAKRQFRFLHVSTDEVFGALGETGRFNESTNYAPNSPYSASKASSDHFVRAWYHTYGLPTITTNCSNNYGPRQFPEKLIPRMILCALEGVALPVYGRGANVRDWIHVDDHCQGVMLAYERGTPGQTYCFGGQSERRNLDVVNSICQILDRLQPKADGQSYAGQIDFVQDRQGHDFRYAIDDQYAQTTLGFKHQYGDFEKGLEQTIRWYLDNPQWIKSVQAKAGK